MLQTSEGHEQSGTKALHSFARHTLSTPPTMLIGLPRLSGWNGASAFAAEQDPFNKPIQTPMIKPPSYSDVAEFRKHLGFGSGFRELASRAWGAEDERRELARQPAAWLMLASWKYAAEHDQSAR